MGEISGLMIAMLVMFIAVIALAGVLTTTATNYNVTTTSDVQAIVDTANSSTQSLSGWTLDASRNITANDWTGQILWITSGGLSFLSSILTLPSIIHAIFVAFANAIMVPLGIEPAFVSIVVYAVYTIIFMIFIFAVTKAIFKVDL